jgi:hypothetical protein
LKLIPSIVCVKVTKYGVFSSVNLGRIYVFILV